jgi:hypothetical protein
MTHGTIIESIHAGGGKFIILIPEVVLFKTRGNSKLHQNSGSLQLTTNTYMSLLIHT